MRIEDTYIKFSPDWNNNTVICYFFEASDLGNMNLLYETTLDDFLLKSKLRLKSYISNSYNNYDRHVHYITIGSIEYERGVPKGRLLRPSSIEENYNTILTAEYICNGFLRSR